MIDIGMDVILLTLVVIYSGFKLIELIQTSNKNFKEIDARLLKLE